MYLYLKMSRQDAISQIKKDTVIARNALSDYEGTEFGEMMPLASRVLGLSGKHFAVVLGPAVLSSLPALTLIVWVSSQFGVAVPAAGTKVLVTTTPATQLVWSDKVSENDMGYTVAWPGQNEAVTAKNKNGKLLFQLGAGTTPFIHKKIWWNSLIANPAGYLPENSSIELVEIQLPMQQFLPWGPDWLRDWAGLFFIVLLGASIGIKVIFKIH